MKTQDKPRVVESSSIQENLHRKRLFQFVVSMVALLLALPAFAATQRTFSFTVPTDSKTSGGVYDSTGTLIKTLWSGRSYHAGTHYVVWDGFYDQHADVTAPAPEGTYSIKVLTHNVQYNWDGVVGNTSSSFASRNLWKSLFGPSDMGFSSSGVGVVVTGFNEGQASARRFFTSDPQTPTPVPDSSGSAVNWALVAVDGSRYYVAVRGSGGGGGDQTSANIVVARNIADDSTYHFTTSGQLAAVGQNQFPSAIDVSQQFLTPPAFDPAFAARNNASGLAVQQSGNVLAVAHGPLNVVRLFHKLTGDALGQIAINSPGRMSFARNGDLYVVIGTTVSRFAAGTLGQTNTPISSITGLTSPQAIATSPTDSNTVLITDDGSSQQVKAFTYTSSWALAWTLGQPGGYNATNGPDVTEAAATVKFKFDGALLAFQADGSFWVGDYGNYRILHYSANRSYLGQIAFIDANYHLVTDQNDPTRVFTGLLEYRIDYSKPLIPGDPGSNGAWKLVKNWRAGLSPFYKSFASVVTLEGHTYAGIQNESYVDQIFELPPGGLPRSVGQSPPGQGWTGIYNNGAFRQCRGQGSGNISVANVAGTGFASGNPTWNFAAETIICSTPANAPTREESYDPSPGLGAIHLTSSNLVVFFNNVGFWSGRSVPGSYHLGAVPVGGTNWLWRTSPGKQIRFPDGEGSFTTDGVFGGLAGIGVFTAGTDIVWGFNGQYAYFSNQYVHYSDNGLFVGQFGAYIGNETTPGFAGNILGMGMVKHGGKLYVYTTDESAHSGIHRWSASGLDTIQTVTGSASPNPANPAALVANPYTATQMALYWSDNSYNETGFKVERADDANFTVNVTQVTTTAANATSFIDSGLTLFKTYYYRVKATNASGDSNYSISAPNEPADKLTGVIIPNDQGHYGHVPGHAFDGDFTTYFRPSGFFSVGWVGYDLGSPKTFSAIKFAASGEGNSDGMIDAKFQVSNSADFSSGVVDLHHVLTEPAVGQLTTVKFSPRVGGYRYVRCFNSAHWLAIAEMEFYGSSVFPTVSLTAPTVDQLYPTAPANVTLTATASEAGGTISKVEFHAGATLLNTDTTAPYSYNWLSVPAGWYPLTARAYDANNVWIDSSKVPIRVGSATIPNLIGNWKLDEGSGLTTADATLNNHPGTLANGPVWTAGKYGNGLSFDGVNDRVEVASTFGLGNSDVTVSCWVNLSSTSQRGTFVKIGEANGFGIGVGNTTAEEDGNNLIIIFEQVRWINTGVHIGTGWQHVAVTISSSGVAQAYINGLAVNTPTGGNAIAPTGQTYIGGDRHINAVIDEVQVFSRALTEAEIQAVRNTSSTPAAPSGRRRAP